jgi:hypothetical protein
MDKGELARILLAGIAIDATRGCWVWQHNILRGYGRIKIAGRSYYVHRLALYVWRDFDLDSPLVVRHECDNPPCLNPAHLLVGTRTDNVRDMVTRGRQKRSDPARDAMVRELWRRGMTPTDIARLTGVNGGTVRRLVRTM